MHPAITNSDRFIQQFSSCSFQSDPFMDIYYQVKTLKDTNTVPLKDRIQLIEKLSYCRLIAISQWQAKQSLNPWNRLLEFLGFSSSTPLPYFAALAKDICEKTMKDLSKRQKNYEWELRSGVDTCFRTLIRHYNITCSVNSGCGSRGNLYINNSLRNIQDFTAYHPEYLAQLPNHTICEDDGTGGFASGIATGFSSLN